MKVSKMMDKGMDYANDAVGMARDYLPSAHQMGKMKMKTDAKLAKGITHAMPEKVKKMELAKMLLLPAAGAVVALLFAPKSGRELRNDIKVKFTDAKDMSMDKAHEWKEVGTEKAQEWKETGTEKAQEWKEMGTEKAHNLAEKAKDVKEDVSEKVAKHDAVTTDDALKTKETVPMDDMLK